MARKYQHAKTMSIKQFVTTQVHSKKENAESLLKQFQGNTAAAFAKSNINEVFSDVSVSTKLH